jgi:M6 family metalloprotease-like protein
MSQASRAKPKRQAKWLVACALLAVVTLAGADPVNWATLGHFGYGTMKRDNVAALGTPPLLLILATVSNQPALRHDTAYYNNLVFSTNAGVSSLNNYLQENSNGRFRWESASGAPVRVSLATNESLDALEQYMIDAGLTNMGYSVHWFENTWFSNVISKASTQGGFNFDAYDTNPRDGKVSRCELGVVVIANDRGSPGLGRWPNSKIEGTSLTFTGLAAGGMEVNGNEMGFNVFVHEATHLLGCIDLYGKEECLLGMNLSLYCDKITKDPDDIYPNITGNAHEIYHLDPWHKLKLGWIEPRICSLRESGSTTLCPPQSGLTNAYAIFYDPDDWIYGHREFLIAEYRAYNTSYGAGFDANVAGNGVVFWHVLHDWYLNPCRITCGCGYCTYGQNTDNYAVFTEGAPNRRFGGWIPWIGNRTISNFKFIDPSIPEPKLFPARFHVQPFVNGADSVTLSWTHADQVWVEFRYIGWEAGSYSQPYATLEKALGFASPGSFIRIKAATNNVTLSIGTGGKAVTIDSYGGSATIGR